MRRTLALAATALFGITIMATHGGGIAAPEPRLMIGPGAVPCEMATAEKGSNKPSHSQRLAWMLGYVSNYNSIKGVNILEGSDLHANFAWVDEYCAANPDAPVSKALDLLIFKLEERRRRS